jgi:hypothetical protein
MHMLYCHMFRCSICPYFHSVPTTITRGLNNTTEYRIMSVTLMVCRMETFCTPRSTPVIPLRVLVSLRQSVPLRWNVY